MPGIFKYLEAGCLQVNLMSTSAQINQLIYYTILLSQCTCFAHAQNARENTHIQSQILVCDSFINRCNSSYLCSEKRLGDDTEQVINSHTACVFIMQAVI